jgi:Asp-tRNA(Asn)/Glu-tRNA(Gln) amidotransferase C subunit
VLRWVDALWPTAPPRRTPYFARPAIRPARADEPGPMLPHERVLAGAPDPREGSLAVPRIVEG